MTPRPTAPRRRNGLAAFRAVEPEVRAALSAGWTLVAIYAEKRSRLGMSYAQFARYAQPLRAAARAHGAQARSVPAPAAARPRAPVAASPASRSAGPPRGRPEDAVPTLNMDGFATQVLKNEDLF